jgi:hypothetical protein
MLRSIFLSLTLLTAQPLLAQTAATTVHTSAELAQVEAKLQTAAEQSPTGEAGQVLEDQGTSWLILVSRARTGEAELHNEWADESSFAQAPSPSSTAAPCPKNIPSATARASSTAPPCRAAPRRRCTRESGCTFPRAYPTGSNSPQASRPPPLSSKKNSRVPRISILSCGHSR